MILFDPDLRSQRMRQAINMFILTVVFVGIALFAGKNLDETGLTFLLVAAGAFLVAGLFFLWRARRTPKDAVAVTAENLPQQPVPVQLQHYRRILWMSAFAFPILSGFIVYELNRLESGEVERVNIFAPAALLYNHLGYWPAVLVVPVLGVVCIPVLILKMRRLRSGQSGSAKV
jgi:hypothetical protein